MTAGTELVDFDLEQGWVEYDTIADDVDLIALENTGRDGTQYVFLTVEFQGVSCIGAALEAANQVVTGG